MTLTPSTVPDWPGPNESAGFRRTLERLADHDGPADQDRTWSADLWRELEEAGATRWALARSWGGEGVERDALVVRYARLAEASLTAAFVLTQHDAAIRRLAAAEGPGKPMAEGWLEMIGAGRCHATVGISQLTTSRRHGARAMTARTAEDGSFRLDGAMPWVTAAPAADVIVTGAVLEDGRQLLAAVPAGRSGMRVGPPYRLAALEASCTCEIGCDDLVVHRTEVLAGPAADVMAIPGLAGTGGLETSALALGQARAALVALASEAPRREDLSEPLEVLIEHWRGLAADLLATAKGEAGSAPAGVLRSRANNLVLRATQAYLTARKGSGFLLDDPAQRWARQALFFLVWSCPAPIAAASLRDLVGLCSS